MCSVHALLFCTSEAHWCYKKLRKSAHAVIVNLALADLCVTAVADPACVVGRWRFLLRVCIVVLQG